MGCVQSRATEEMKQQRERQPKSAIASYKQRQQLLKQRKLPGNQAHSFRGVATEFWGNCATECRRGHSPCGKRQLLSVPQEKPIVRFCEKPDDLGYPLEVAFVVGTVCISDQ